MYQSFPISHLTQSVERARANHAEAKFKFDLALATVLVRLERFVYESTRSYCENLLKIVIVYAKAQDTQIARS